MTTAETILVVLLGASLLALLILSIVLISLLIAVVRNLHHITRRAEAATESVADLATGLSKRLAPMATSALVAAMVRKFAGKAKRGQEDKSDE